VKRPLYDKALVALNGAYRACYDQPDRDVLGMSHGPFSGVNVALMIVANLEKEMIAIQKIRLRIKSETEAAMRRQRFTAKHKPGTYKRKH